MDDWKTGKPSKHGRYLVYSADHGVCIERYAADGEWWYRGSLMPDVTVLAWMDLPEPPNTATM